MALYQVAACKDRTYQLTIATSCVEFAAEEWAERYCAEQSEYGLTECFVWFGASGPIKVHIDIETSPVFTATILTP